jgi:hypothetical protein
MDAASKILVVGGLLNLLYGLVTGIPLGRIRETEPEAPKYLMLAHIGPLMWGPILLGCVFAVQLSVLPAALETVAAASLVTSSVLLGLKDTWHWRRDTRDEFAEKPAPFYLGIPMALLAFVGLGLLIVGVLGGV